MVQILICRWVFVMDVTRWLKQRGKKERRKKKERKKERQKKERKKKEERRNSSRKIGRSFSDLLSPQLHFKRGRGKREHFKRYEEV